MEDAHFKNLYDECVKSLTTFQNSLHMPGDLKLGVENPVNRIHTPFFNTFGKSTWYYHHTKRLSTEIDPKGIIKYTVDPYSQGLAYVVLIQELPAIILKKPSNKTINGKTIVKYEGKWTHNIGTNNFIKGNISFNNDIIQTLDYTTIDKYYQSMITNDNRANHNKNIGNIPMLQNWNTATPAYKTKFIMPWFYTESILPMYLFGYHDKVTHEFELRRKISDLYQVRALYSDGTWDYVPFDNKSISRVGSSDDFNIDTELKIPDLLGKYMCLHDMEMNYNRKIIENDPIHQRRSVIYVNDTLIYESNTEYSLGEVATIDFKEPLGIPHTYSWVAQNMDALKNKSYSNYSTHIEHNLGYSPIENTTINTGKHIMLNKTSNDETEGFHIEKHFICMPNESGYNYWTLGNNIKYQYNYPLPGLFIKEGKIDVQLNDNNPYLSLPENHELAGIKCTSKFKLKLSLTYLKKIVFTSYPKNENERKTINAQIIIYK